VPVPRFFLPVILIFLIVLNACGGGSSSSASGSGGNVTGGGAPGSPALVSVTANATASGINISVVSPHSSPAPNVKFLGVNLAQGGASATGDTVSRGQGTATITTFGPGLSSTMKVSITGPNDIVVGALTQVTAQDGTPGVQIPITLTGNTALGARTLVMQNSKNDVTTFSGGLEVVP
jgi:hypothetical protein